MGSGIAESRTGRGADEAAVYRIGGAPEPPRPVPRRAPRLAAWSLWTCGALALAPALEGCQTVPITGRRSVNLLSVDQDVQLGAEAYAQILSQERIVTSGPDLAMVRRIMDRIVAVADDPGFEWEVNLIDNDEVVNAFALPGGKMAVYSGILPVAGSEAGLAVVMGHEIGHVVARHGAERLSRQMGVDVVLQLFEIERSVLVDAVQTFALELPYGRDQELEADHIGLIYMARAGYDPQEAVRFWQRMSGGGGAPPEWMSTHPSDAHRIEQLQGLMPQALQEWQQSPFP